MRSPGSAGTATATVRPSRAMATPAPLAVLIACATRRAVLKSAAFKPSKMVLPSSSGVGTEASTVAPSGMRPADRWLI